MIMVINVMEETSVLDLRQKPENRISRKRGKSALSGLNHAMERRIGYRQHGSG
jgi:hypothetical protein